MSSADERYEGWVRTVKIVESACSDLFWHQKLFRAVAAMFEQNASLQATGTHVWLWLFEMYGRDAAIAVRRELDDQKGVASLRNLLWDLEKHASVLTRERYANLLRHSVWPRSEVDEQFQRLGGPPGPGSGSDHIAAASVATDRKELERVTKKAVQYANRLVAHRTPSPPALTVAELSEAVEGVYVCLQKYLVLLTGIWLASATPFPAYDWLAPFRQAWLPDGFKPPPEVF